MKCLTASGLGLLAAFATTVLAMPAHSQPFGRDAGPVPLSWTDWADLALASDVVLTGGVSKITKLKKNEAPDVPPGQMRALVQVNLLSVMKAPSILPEGAAWLWQGALDGKNKAPFKTKQVMLAFAKPLAGGARPEVQALELVSVAGMQPWTPEAEAIVRDVLVNAQQPGARGLMVTGISDAFRSEGDIPGTSESQFFLNTQGGKPMTLVVRRKPGQAPIVEASASEFVQAGSTIVPRTLLWRGLACGLPETLDYPMAEQAGLVEDYATARQVIGACGRTVVPPRP